MNVLLSAVSSSSIPDGVSRHAANVARCLLLQPEIHRVDLVVGAWQWDSLHSLLGVVDEGVRVSIADTQRSGWLRNQWTWTRLPDLARAFESDVVHVTYPVPFPRASFSCPVVATLHDLYPYDSPENFGYPKVFLNRLILRQCLHSADRIACVSNTTLQRLEVHFPHALRKAVVVPNSVGAPPDSGPHRPVIEGKGEPLLLCVAQHRRNKNIPLALEAFHVLLSRGDLPNQSRLLIVGAEGPETGDIKALIEQHRLGSNVVLLRGLSEAEIHWCYSNCDLLLAPSTLEGFGLPVVEGMMHRCRILCSDIAAFREAGGSYCDYVPLSGSSVHAFANAMRDALLNTGFRSPQVERFSSALAGRAYLRVYLELLQEAKGRSHNLTNSTPALERGNHDDPGAATEGHCIEGPDRRPGNERSSSAHCGSA